MNKARRRTVNDIKERLEREIEKLKSELEDVRYDEEYAYDSMPDNLKGSIRGEESEEAINAMIGAEDKLEEALDCLQEII